MKNVLSRIIYQNFYNISFLIFNFCTYVSWKTFYFDIHGVNMLRLMPYPWTLALNSSISNPHRHRHPHCGIIMIIIDQENAMHHNIPVPWIEHQFQLSLAFLSYGNNIYFYQHSMTFSLPSLIVIRLPVAQPPTFVPREVNQLGISTLGGLRHHCPCCLEGIRLPTLIYIQGISYFKVSSQCP